MTILCVCSCCPASRVLGATLVPSPAADPGWQEMLRKQCLWLSLLLMTVQDSPRLQKVFVAQCRPTHQVSYTATLPGLWSAAVSYFFCSIESYFLLCQFPHGSCAPCTPFGPLSGCCFTGSQHFLLGKLSCRRSALLQFPAPHLPRDTSHHDIMNSKVQEKNQGQIQS